MADYFSSSSFIVPCSKEQAQIALRALQHFQCEITEFAIQATQKAAINGLSFEEKIIRHCLSQCVADDFFWSFDAAVDNQGLWIHEMDCFCLEAASVFAQAILAAFDLPCLVKIEVAESCNKPRPNAFLGHGCVVTKNHIRANSFFDFWEAELDAHDNSERYFLCHITEVNGEYEYPSPFLMVCPAQEDPVDRLEKIALNYRGNGHLDEFGDIQYACGTSAKDPYLDEIEPLEFRVMKKHIPVL